MSVILAIALAAAALVTACIPSLHPFYTQKDLRYDERLIGQWGDTNASTSQIWSFTKSGTNEYDLTIIETANKDTGIELQKLKKSGTNGGYDLAPIEAANKTGKFSARLFVLKNQYYLDLIPTECQFATNQADLVAFSVFPGHLLVAVPQLGQELQLSFFDFKWLQEHLKANPKAIACHTEGDRFILTASTRELQRFVLNNQDKLFETPLHLVRLGAAKEE